MKSTIQRPNKELFEFDKLSLLTPVSVTGGAYLTKIEHNNKPLYIQCSKCVSKQGLVYNKKKKNVI